MKLNKSDCMNSKTEICSGPFKYLKPSVRTEAYFLLAFLVPQLLLLALTRTKGSLLIVLSAVLASVCSELLDLKIRGKDKFTWTMSIIRGILIGLFLPETFPPVPVFFASFFTLSVNKFILGGFANSWVNPAAMTVAVCWIVGMKFFPAVSAGFSELQGRNPALALIQNGTFPVNSLDLKITAFLNHRIFSIFKVSIPDGYVSLLWDSHSVIPAFRFNLLTIISSVFLLGFDILNPIIPACFIVSYSVLVKFVSPFFTHAPIFQGDIILALLTSGTLFGAFFLLQWHGTTPLTNRGKIAYGIFAGIVAFFLSGCGTSSSGMIFTVLISNIFALLVNSAEKHYFSNFCESVLKKRVQKTSEGLDA